MIAFCVVLCLIQPSALPVQKAPRSQCVFTPASGGDPVRRGWLDCGRMHYVRYREWSA